MCKPHALCFFHTVLKRNFALTPRLLDPKWSATTNAPKQTICSTTNARTHTLPNIFKNIPPCSDLVVTRRLVGPRRRLWPLHALVCARCLEGLLGPQSYALPPISKHYSNLTSKCDNALHVGVNGARKIEKRYTLCRNPKLNPFFIALTTDAHGTAV